MTELLKKYRAFYKKEITREEEEVFIDKMPSEN